LARCESEAGEPPERGCACLFVAACVQGRDFAGLRLRMGDIKLEGDHRMKKTELLVTTGRIEGAIFLVRGHKVLLDADLAALYGVETRSLVQAVKRNIQRFPSDFMFQLNEEEFAVLRSQIVISKGKGGRRYLMSSLNKESPCFPAC